MFGSLLLFYLLHLPPVPLSIYGYVCASMCMWCVCVFVYVAYVFVFFDCLFACVRACACVYVYVVCVSMRLCILHAYMGITPNNRA